VSKRAGSVHKSGRCRNRVKSCWRPNARDGSIVLSDVREPTLAIVCEPAGATAWRGDATARWPQEFGAALASSRSKESWCTDSEAVEGQAIVFAWPGPSDGAGEFLDGWP
jgi:hypothetical protein